MSSNWDGQRNFQGLTGNAQAAQAQAQQQAAPVAPVARVASAFERAYRSLESFDLAVRRDRGDESLAALLAPAPDGPLREALSALLQAGLRPQLASRREGSSPTSRP